MSSTREGGGEGGVRAARARRELGAWARAARGRRLWKKMGKNVKKKKRNKKP
jgi:hypothetical protein